jgi:ArsR family transcriptional regulator
MIVEELPLVRQRGSCCELDIAIEPGQASDAAALFKVLADPTRLGILATLRQSPDPVCICDFTAAYDLSQPTISHHMGKLKAAGLVESHKAGIWVYYRIAERLPAAVGRLLEAALS